MKLKKDTQIVHVVDYNDLDKFINHHFPWLGGNYEFVADTESSNGCHSLIHAPGKLYPWWKKDLGAKKKDVGISALMNDLVIKQKLLPGNYLIEVSW